MKLTKNVAESFIKDPKNIDLSVYTEIEIDASKILQKSKFYKLNLSGLTHISNEVLKSLVKFKGWLILNGLAEIDDVKADIISSHIGALSLDTLKTIESSVFQKLINKSGDIYLHGLNDINKDCLSFIKQTTGRLVFNKSLSSNKGIKTYLDACIKYQADTTDKLLTKEDAMSILSNYNNKKSLSDFEVITKDAAKYVASRKENDLKLNGITCIDDDKMNELVKFRSDNTFTEAQMTNYSKLSLELNGLIDVSEGALINLFTNFKGHLIRLNSIKHISDSVAEAISNYRYEVFLDGIETLSEKASYLLSIKPGLTRNNRISLNGLKKINAEVAENLSRFSGGLHLEGLSELSKEVTEKLSNYKGTYYSDRIQLPLPSIKSINLEIAKELSKIEFPLILSGLTHLDNECAKVLSNSKTKYISLDGLEEINPQALSHFKGKDINIRLGGIKNLNIEIADVLSNLKSENSLSFNAIREFSMEVLEKLQECNYDIYFKEIDFLDSISLEYLKSCKTNRIKIELLNNFPIANTDIILELGFGFSIEPEIMNEQFFEAITNFIKKDRYNFQKIKATNFEALKDQLILHLANKKDFETLDLINPNMNGNPASFNTLKFVNKSVMELIKAVITRYGNDSKSIYLNNIIEIDLESLLVLKEISEIVELYSINLNGLNSLDEKKLEILSSCKTGVLSLNSLKDIPLHAGKHLSKISGKSTKTIETEKYIQVGTTTKRLNLNGLEKLDEEFANALKHFDGELELNGINKIDNNIIDLIENCNRNLYLKLKGICELDNEEVNHISKFNGKSVDLNNNELYISEQGIEYLAKLDSITLYSDYYKKLEKFREH
jgi:hypothetical protein